MKKIILMGLLIITALCVFAQQPGSNSIRIADTLTAKEKTERNAVLLRTELDSLIKIYPPVQNETGNQNLATEKKYTSLPYYLASGAVVLLLIVSGIVLLTLYHQKKELNKLLAALKKSAVAEVPLSSNGKQKHGKKNQPGLLPEEKTELLVAELNKLEKENQGLQGVIKEYNGIQNEYDSLKYAIRKAYKIKNYPGYDKTKNESAAIKTVLDTEKAIAGYAYEKFLKPLLSITDMHKNSPAKMDSTEGQKIFDLLISLSLLYIEYLYLRVNDLSVGGTIVERIKDFAGGNAAAPGLLKKLNTESGSRALVVRMALNRVEINNLSYPVFDETNLNNQ